MKSISLFALFLVIPLSILAACSNTTMPSSSTPAQGESSSVASIATAPVSVTIEDVASQIIPYYPEGVEFEYIRQDRISDENHQDGSFVSQECYLFDVTHEGEKVSGVAVGIEDGSIWIWNFSSDMWLTEGFMGLPRRADEPRQKMDTVTTITANDLSNGGINLYFSYLDTIPELTSWNTGSVWWYEKEQRIEITAIKNTGSAGGTMDGPAFELVASWASGNPEIISVEYTPAPVYSQPSQVLLSGETIRIEPDRLVEIAEYFKELHLQKRIDAELGLQEHDVVVYGEEPSDAAAVEYQGLSKEEWEGLQTEKAAYEAMTAEKKAVQVEYCRRFIHLFWEETISIELVRHVGSDQFEAWLKEQYANNECITIYSFADHFSMDFETLITVTRGTIQSGHYPLETLKARYSYLSHNGENYVEEPTQSDREGGSDTLSEVEAQAEMIVTGKIIDDGTEKVSEPGESPHYGFTVYKLQVTGVYAGDVTSGDTINMIENHLSGRETFIAESNYLPSVKDKEYLFFLYQTETDSPGAGAWFPVSAEYGRYPIIQSSEIKAAQEYRIEELGLAKEDAAYRAIWETVIEKYMK